MRSLAMMALAMFLPVSAALAKSPSTWTPTIAITAATTALWTVRYTLAAAAVELVFERSPDSSRANSWTAPAGFLFGQDERGEFLRRRDGAPFRSVVLQVPPVYRLLPKDYGPFSPFGDGGTLFHSGRYFACAGSCPDDRVRWRMSVTGPAASNVIVDGRISRQTARWTDQDDGRNIYVGPARPVPTADVIAVIDRALPDRIRTQLNRDLPRYLAYFAERLGGLPARPLLFVSYDTSHTDGWGRQGGTLPGQVFVHFYGKQWSAEMAKPDFGFDLAWHLGHEAGHLYQRGITEPGSHATWVHEGGAEAFAAIAVAALDPASTLAVARKTEAARAACAITTRERSLNAVIAAGDFQASYSCGLILSLELNDAIKRLRPGSDGLFAVWRAMIADRRDGAARFDPAVRKVAGPCVAEALATAAASPGGALRNGLMACRPVRYQKSGNT